MTEEELPEPGRTIIQPSPAPKAEVDANPRTVIAGLGHSPESAVAAAQPAPPSRAPRTGAGIQVGDVLNHIFEVKRFLARGGMGEVFEGINVNSDERVAIKVILPALASDPNVQAMFRREARTLTRLSHPALVQYRVLAQEPELGVFYIVTEFIDGVNLSDALGTLTASPEDLIGLTRRLAEGLRAAHALGVIHRDISPDNVLLEDQRLDRARIIDFGIVKDLDPGSKTIIGDGFAGKLGYVAPEQLGDFDREVGPWSDIYALGLVILAVALGRNVDMGASFVEAIDRRRKGVDCSAAPAMIRPVLEKMLAADPAQRLRSMDDVVAALNALDTSAHGPASKTPAAKKTPTPKREKPAPAAKPDTAGAQAAAKPRLDPKLLIGGGVLAAVLVLGGGWWALSGPDAPVAPPVVASAPAAGGSAAPAVATARTAVAAILPALECTWLDLTDASASPAGVGLRFAGVAGRPVDAEAGISREVAAKNVSLANVDFSEVAPISVSACAAIDAFRQVQADTTPHLSVPQRKFEMSVLPPDSNYAGKVGARAVLNLDLSASASDFALYGIEPSGAISTIVPSREAFAAMPKNGTPIADLGGGRYRLQIDADHSGWSGILLLRGRGGFSDSLITGARGADWQKRFAEAADAGEWQSEMVWFKMVDEIPQ